MLLALVEMRQLRAPFLVLRAGENTVIERTVEWQVAHQRSMSITLDGANLGLFLQLLLENESSDNILGQLKALGPCPQIENSAELGCQKFPWAWQGTLLDEQGTG